MSTPVPTALRAALIAALVAAAPLAHSQMYRWIDAQGAVTYSNQLPGDMSVVRDLTVVLDNPDKPVATRTEPQRGAAGTVPPLTEPPQAAPRVVVSPKSPEAVRDPCLRSADPKCIERNKAAYVPGRGYTPGTAVGATSSAAAGGTLAGGSLPPPPSKLTPPKSAVYALPPGSEPATDRKR